MGLALTLLLTGCASVNKSNDVVIHTAPPMEEFVLEETVQEKAYITFNLEGKQETVPAYIFEGMDYTIVVPDGGWHMYEPGAWQATFNQSVKFWIKGYSGDNAKKLVEELSSKGYVLAMGGSIMTKTGADDLVENVMIFRNGDSMKAVFYCYPESLREGFGVRLDTIVNTFSWKDPQANATSGNMAGLTDAELQDALNGSASIIETKEGQSPQAAQIAMIISNAEAKSKPLEEELQSAATQTDLNIASGELYNVWDEAINSVWAILRETMGEREFDLLLDQQLIWIEQKELEIQRAVAQYQGGSMAALVANQTATEMTRERVYVLAEYIE
jgi:uncharacterized protein YecT (DUF1311 family)